MIIADGEDPVDYGDPLGWGFCKYCAFVVATRVEDGVMLKHERRSGSWDSVDCYGGGRESQWWPPVTAEPVSWERERDETIVKGSE